jgi:hypothetical protein
MRLFGSGFARFFRSRATPRTRATKAIDADRTSSMMRAIAFGQQTGVCSLASVVPHVAELGGTYEG